VPDYRSERIYDEREGSERVCRELAAVFPQAHVLLVTRGFKTMMLSGYSQYVKTGGSDEFFGARRDFGNTDDTRHAWDYNHLVACYKAAFGDRLLVLPYEMLREEPQRFTRLLEGRFGLSPVPLPSKRLNVSLSPVELRWYPRIARVFDYLPLGTRLRRICIAFYARVVNRNLLRAPIGLLQWLYPLEALNEGMISERVLESFRGKAISLRDDPIYAPYADEYLFHGACRH
jgi:hypothetical protein